MLRCFFNRWVEKYSLLTIIGLMFTLSFINILCLDVDGISAEESEIGVKPGDWIEYEINWTVPPPWPHPVWIRRKILDVEGTIITVNITQEMSIGTVTSETKEGDITNGTGASAMIFIPANLETGDWVYIEGFDSVRINGTTKRVYLGIERTILYADFSSHGFNILIFWDKEKGAALEIHSSGTYTSTIKVINTNLFNSKSFENDNPLLGLTPLILIVITLVAFVIGNRYVRSKRKKRKRKKSRSSLHDVLKFNMK